MKKTFSIKKHRVILSACVSVFIIMFVFVVISRDKMSANVSRSELAYTDISPLGTSGGSVMPASCDSYPAHSTCACTLGATQSVGCSVANGTGSQTNTCVASGDNWVWSSNGACVMTGCNAGYTKVTDWHGTYCKASCTGNSVMTNVPTEMRTGCAQWCSTPQACVLNKSEDTKTFANIISIEKAYALYCIDPIYTFVPIATCVACPVGQIPNSDHTACVTPAVPAVNVHF